MPLPVNISALIHGRTVEWERLEFKKGWNPLDTLHTICAFANDFHNLGGGYIILGVQETKGRPVLPPAGLDPGSFDAIQKELLNLGNSAIQPAYHPVVIPYRFEGRDILIIWVPGGQTRPYRAKLALGKINPDRSVRLEQLRIGRAMPRRYRNRRIGEFLKELDLTEGRATGIPKILRAMKENGSPPPEFDFDEEHSYFLVRLPVNPESQQTTEHEAGDITPPVTPPLTPPVTPPLGPPIKRLLVLLAEKGDMGNAEIRRQFGLKDRTHVRNLYIDPALEAGLIEYTLPGKPTSRLQKYRLTDKGRAWLDAVKERQGKP
jgi:predicted HTH transcriptional regulator